MIRPQDSEGVGGDGDETTRGGAHADTEPAPPTAAVSNYSCRVDTGCRWRQGDDARTWGMTAQHPAPTTASTRSQGGLGANGHVTSPDAYAHTRRHMPYAYAPAVLLHK
jgi:hypothetical protein